MSDKGVCRTAPAIPGLLLIQEQQLALYNHQKFSTLRTSSCISLISIIKTNIYIYIFQQQQHYFHQHHNILKLGQGDLVMSDQFKLFWSHWTLLNHFEILLTIWIFEREKNHFGTILVYCGQLWAILDHCRPLWTILDIKTNLDHLYKIWTIYKSVEQLGLFLQYL